MTLDPNGPLGPRGRIGSVINVVFCAGLIAGLTVMGFTQDPICFLFATLGVLIEIQFVRIMLQARRQPG